MIKKTQEFIYFQNKAKHYDNLRKVRSPISCQINKNSARTSPIASQLRKPSALRSESSMQPPPIQNKAVLPASEHSNRLPHESYNDSYRRRVEDEQLIDRLVTISRSKAQIANEGYSRYFKIERKFKEANLYRSLEHRKLQIDNLALKERIKRITPAIGQNAAWGKDYRRKVELKRNISRHWGSTLHVSTQSYIPRVMKNFLQNVEEGESKDQMVVRWVKLMDLPEISQKKKAFLFQKN